MLDLKHIRAAPEDLDKALQSRGASVVSKELLDLDKQVRVLGAALEKMRSRKKELARSQERDSSMRDAGVALRKEISLAEKELSETEKRLQNFLEVLPNVPADDVPAGQSEDQNVCVRKWGTPPSFDFEPKPHYVLGERLGLDAQAGVKLAGSRFVCLKGFMARLERALAAFMLDLHTQHFGYEEIAPPFLVKEDMLFGVGQLPKFADDAFQTTDGRWLISTAEVALTNLARDVTLKADALPQKYTAYTPCFRSESGAAGKDTRGLIRLHQFSKVELVIFAHPEDAVAQHEKMLGHAESVLQKLELPYRVVSLCTGDLGFSARKTYDIEVWLPAQKSYREISSCSNCGDFQARRMRARFQDDSGERGFIHTLNGSGLPLGRTIAALLENGQQADGTILWPKALQPYLGSF